MNSQCHISPAGFRRGPLLRSNWNLEMLVFREGRKSECWAGENPSFTLTNLNPYMAAGRNRSQTTFACATPALHSYAFLVPRASVSIGHVVGDLLVNDILRRVALGTRMKLCKKGLKEPDLEVRLYFYSGFTFSRFLRTEFVWAQMLSCQV